VFLLAAPLPSPLESCGAASTGQLRIGQPLAGDVSHDLLKAILIVHTGGAGGGAWVREEGLGAKVRTAEAGAGRYDGLGDGAEPALGVVRPTDGHVFASESERGEAEARG